MAFQVDTQSCPNREEYCVSNNKYNNTSEKNTTTGNQNKKNFLSNTIGISSRRNDYQDPGAEHELSSATNKRVDKYKKFGEFRNWKCIGHNFDYCSKSGTKSDPKNIINYKRGSKRNASPKATKCQKAIAEQNNFKSSALFTASASEKVFSEKKPIAVPRGDPESKLIRYIELFYGIFYAENIDYDDGNSVDQCRSINDGHEWSSAPICYNS